MTRLLVLGGMLIFIAGFAFLTVTAIAEQGFNPLSALSILILVILAVGVVGSLRNPPE
jgi:hypothetical protein